MDRAQLHRLDINLLLAFDALISERIVTKAAQLGEFGGEIEHADVRLPVRLPYPTRASRTGFGPPPGHRPQMRRYKRRSDGLRSQGIGPLLPGTPGHRLGENGFLSDPARQPE